MGIEITDKKLNIAVNARFLQTFRMEGVGRYMFETISRLALNYPQHNYYLLFDRAFDSSFIFSKNVFPIIIPPQSRHPILWKIWFEFMLPRVFKKHKIDVFYSADTFLSLKSKVPSLIVCHDIAYVHYPEHIRKIHLNYYKKYFPKFHSRANHIITVSNFTKNDIIETYNLPIDKITVASNALPEGIYPLSVAQKTTFRNSITDGFPYFIFVGSIHPRKNLVNLILAFDILKQQGNNTHKLLIIGRMGWKNDILQSIYKDIKHKDDIIFCGHIDGNISQYIASAEALMYVSLFEGFGIPILEAMKCEVPVITSNVSSMPEVAGDSAILVDPHRPTDIAMAMSSIISDNELRTSCILKGIKRVKEFSWDTTTEIIYKKLVEISK